MPDDVHPVHELETAVHEFVAFLNTLPVSALTEKVCGPKEILAHLLLWLESYVTQAEAILADAVPILPKGHFDDLNAQSIAASRGVPAIVLVERYQTACTQLTTIAYTHDPEQIILTLKRGSSFRHPLTKYLTAEAGHIRWHQTILERQATGAYLQDIKKLQEAVTAFCSFLQQLPEANLDDQEFGPKEVLAYLCFWHEQALAQVEAHLVGEPVEVPKGSLKQLSDQAVAAGRGLSVQGQLRRFQTTNEQLCHFGRTLDPQMYVIAVRSHHHTLDGAIATLATHIRHQHQGLIRAKK